MNEATKLLVREALEHLMVSDRQVQKTYDEIVVSHMRAALVLLEALDKIVRLEVTPR